MHRGALYKESVYLMKNKLFNKKIIKRCFIASFAIGSLWFMSGCGKFDEDELIIKSVSEYTVEESVENNEAEISMDNTMVCLYVCGAVNSPGVYELPKGSRLYEAISMAGGFMENADETYINMAREINDGEQVIIYTRDETKDMAVKEAEIQLKSGLVNINTAGISELTTISGIGESRAQAIITYRETNGAFSCIEDIKKVDGIKDGLFSKIKDKITV
jgi:competence protein ComEA